jgi:hypothetical protein
MTDKFEYIIFYGGEYSVVQSTKQGAEAKVLALLEHGYPEDEISLYEARKIPIKVKREVQIGD